MPLQTNNNPPLKNIVMFSVYQMTSTEATAEAVSQDREEATSNTEPDISKKNIPSKTSPPDVNQAVEATPPNANQAAEATPPAANQSTEGPPPKEQCEIIAKLEEEEESIHVYCVSKEWYEQWQRLVGLRECNEEHQEDRDKLGPMDMDIEDEDNNMMVDEKIWKKWVAWYGISETHELDRRNWASDEKEFEITILSPMCMMIDNPVKNFDISEETGYIELQLRRIFHISDYRKSRLWAQEKRRHAKFQIIIDRKEEICFQDAIDHNCEYLIAIEIANHDGSWPSGFPGEPLGDFDKYSDVAGTKKSSVFWEDELQKTVETVFTGISSELKETAAGVVQTAKCITKNKEEEINEKKEHLDKRLKDVGQMIQKLEKKSNILREDENKVKDKSEKVKSDQEKLEKEWQKLEEEIQRMEEINKIQQSRVKLDIGGNVYTTSILTLTNDSNSMLAAMFSGRHSLKQETDGSYFIDRDGTHFRYILNYLRDGGFKEGTLPTDRGFLNELLTEAEYYQIAGLVGHLSEIVENMPEIEDESISSSDSPNKHGGRKRKVASSSSSHRET